MSRSIDADRGPEETCQTARAETTKAFPYSVIV
jgi:hypothetical protein